MDENPAAHDSTIVSTPAGYNVTLKTSDGGTSKSVAGEMGQAINFENGKTLRFCGIIIIQVTVQKKEAGKWILE